MDLVDLSSLRKLGQERVQHLLGQENMRTSERRCSLSEQSTGVKGVLEKQPALSSVSVAVTPSKTTRRGAGALSLVLYMAHPRLSGHGKGRAGSSLQDSAPHPPSHSDDRAPAVSTGSRPRGCVVNVNDEVPLPHPR